MKPSITIKILNEVKCVLIGLKVSDLNILCSEYALFAENYFHNVKYKLDHWDGKYHFIKSNGNTYVFLLPNIIKRIVELGYVIRTIDERDSNLIFPEPIDENFLSAYTFPGKDFKIKLRYYQVDASNMVFKNGTGIIQACTAAGKTLINTALVKQYAEHGLYSITIVPSTTLVGPTASYFKAVGLDVGQLSGSIKDIDHDHVITTWQTLKNYLGIVSQFEVLIIDECHQSKFLSILKKIAVEYGQHIKYRIGLTGTMPKHETNALSVKVALNADVGYNIRAKQLIDEGVLPSLSINIIKLDDKKITTKPFKKFEYEKKYLETCPSRIKFISDEIVKTHESPSKNTNTLSLSSSLPMARALHKSIPNSLYIHSSMSAKKRKEVFDMFDENDNLIVISTTQLLGVGTSIDRVYNLYLIDLGKSFIKVIQGIGRGLRKADDKEHLNVFDITSNLLYSNKHTSARINYYKEAEYPYKITKKIIC